MYHFVFLLCVFHYSGNLKTKIRKINIITLQMKTGSQAMLLNTIFKDG
jgi:hypothetical protein